MQTERRIGKAGSRGRKAGQGVNGAVPNTDIGSPSRRPNAKTAMSAKVNTLPRWLLEVAPRPRRTGQTYGAGRPGGTGSVPVMGCGELVATQRTREDGRQDPAGPVFRKRLPLFRF